MDKNLNIAYDLGLKQSMYCVLNTQFKILKKASVNLRLINTENIPKLGFCRNLLG